MRFISSGIISYHDAMQKFEEPYHEDIIWFLEHPSIYTVGNVDHCDLPQNLPCPVIQSNRGGKITYHGPGQLIVYFIYKLQTDITNFVHKLEDTCMRVFKDLGVDSHGKQNPGVWVNDEKIASIGLRVQKGIVTHGMAININPDLNFFNLIPVCGVLGEKVTSLHKIGIKKSRAEIESLFFKYFSEQLCHKDLSLI